VTLAHLSEADLQVLKLLALNVYFLILQYVTMKQTMLARNYHGCAHTEYFTLYNVYHIAVDL